MASEFERMVNTGDFTSVQELEHKMMSSSSFFGQVLISPVHDAAAKGKLDALRDLLDSPPDLGDDETGEEYKPPSIQSKDNSNNTPLHWAAGAGHLEVVLFLLKSAEAEGILADYINVQNWLGDTALHRAVWRSHTEVVRALIDHNADVSLLNIMKQSPIQLVRGNIEIGCLLQSVGALPGLEEEWGEDEDSFELNLSDTVYSDEEDEEDDDIGILIEENRMKNLFTPPEKPQSQHNGEKLSTQSQQEEEEANEESDDDLPPDLADQEA